MKSTNNDQRPTGEAFHRQYRNFFVGLFIAVPLIILPVFFTYTFFRSDWLAKWDFLYVKYETAGGVAPNGAVTILGMNVGRIEDVSLDPRGFVNVKLKVKREYMGFVRRDSRARLQQKNVAIGDWEIDITRGNVSSPQARSGDTLASEIQAPIARTLDQVTKTVETLQQILQTVLEGKGTVGRLIKEDTLITAANAVARNANGLVLRAYATLGRVDTVLVKFAAVGEKGKGVADSIAAVASKVGKLVTDVNVLANSIQTAAKDLPAVMSRVQTDLSEVELIIKGLQENFLIKGIVNGQPDPMLNDNPRTK
jgi:phospholipid/cholesterol/gamma-HCH transport system substrate-binding protein